MLSDYGSYRHTQRHTPNIVKIIYFYKDLKINFMDFFSLYNLIFKCVTIGINNTERNITFKYLLLSLDLLLFSYKYVLLQEGRITSSFDLLNCKRMRIGMHFRTSI